MLYFFLEIFLSYTCSDAIASIIRRTTAEKPWLYTAVVLLMMDAIASETCIS
jgi:hypothetical protein